MRNKIPDRVAGLAFTSAVAIVPLLIVSASTFALLGFFDRSDALLTPFLRQTLPNMADGILVHLNGFALQYALPIIGLGALAFFGASVFLFRRIENAFNAIWMSPRKWALRHFLVAFPTLIILGPLFLGTAFLLSTQIGDAGSLSFLDLALPSTIAFTFFFLLHSFLPRPRVQLRAALIAGLVSTIGFELLTYGLNAYLRLAIFEPANKVYGTIALLPLAMVSLYALWFIVLMSVELAYSTQHLQTLVTLQRAEDRDPLRKQDRIYNPYIAIELFAPIAAAFKNGEKPLLERHLLEETGYSAPVIRHVVESLVKVGALVTLLDDAGEIQLMPSKQLDDIELLPMIDNFFDASAEVNSEPLADLYSGLRHLNLMTLRGKNALSLVKSENDGSELLGMFDNFQNEEEKDLESPSEQSSLLIYRHPNFTTPPVPIRKRAPGSAAEHQFPPLFSIENDEPKIEVKDLKSKEIYVSEEENLPSRDYFESFESCEIDALVDIVDDENAPGLVERSLSELMEELGNFDLSPPPAPKDAPKKRLN